MASVPDGHGRITSGDDCELIRDRSRLTQIELDRSQEKWALLALGSARACANRYWGWTGSARMERGLASWRPRRETRNALDEAQPAGVACAAKSRRRPGAARPGDISGARRAGRLRLGTDAQAVRLDEAAPVLAHSAPTQHQPQVNPPPTPVSPPHAHPNAAAPVRSWPSRRRSPPVITFIVSEVWPAGQRSEA